MNAPGELDASATAASTPRRQNTLVGLAAALTVLLVWSGWLVASRAGASTDLTIFDITALRFGVAAVLATPFVLYLKPWRGLSSGRIFGLALLLGPPYALFTYGGFVFAPAAHGGIFMNGLFPVLTLLFGWLWFSLRPRPLQLLGVALIFAGVCVAGADTSEFAPPGAWRGDLLFVLAALCFAVYMVVTRSWETTVPQIWLCVPVVNALIYVPVWALFLPSGMATASDGQILLQAFYQGVFPVFLGLAMVAVAIRNLGATATAAVLAGVPALGAVLGIIFLGEVPGVPGWLSLAVVTTGIVITTMASRR